MIRALSAVVFVATVAFSQDMNDALRQRIGEIRDSTAQNQAQLKKYAWTETIEISLKGEAKKREQNACRYGPDGNVQKTPIGSPPPPPSGGPLKRKIAANKIEDLKDYMDRVGALVRRYIPPDSESMQAAYQAGKVTLEPASSSVVFTDYVKPGDKVTISFNPATKKVTAFAVDTYLDGSKDTVTISARFSTLPDGTNFMETSVLNATAKEIRITKTNFGYQRVGS